jgi:hypothetical protein
MTVSWFGPQNQAGDGFFYFTTKSMGGGRHGHTSRSSSLLHLEVCLARVSQFASKLEEERRWVVHVASSRRSREDEVEDGWVDAMACIGPFYHYFSIFVVLGHRGILVFCMGLYIGPKVVGAPCHFSYFNFTFLGLVLVCQELNFCFQY